MSLEAPSMKESAERGKEVQIVLKFQRHGLREGMALTDLGREITRERAEHSGWFVGKEEGPVQFDAAKAIGSSADNPEPTPENPNPMSRTLETAHITATTIAGTNADTWKPRPEERLNYKSIKTPVPYDHIAIYNEALTRAIANLGKGDVGLKDLADEEKIRVTEEAQMTTLEHVSSLNTPEAQTFKKENAGMFADLIEHYIKMTTYLKNKSAVAYIAGTHGGTMEWLLPHTLVHMDAQGNKKVGYDSPDEIGGGFQSSDAYNVEIATDPKGQLKQLRVTFDNPARPQGEMYLDIDKLHELAQFYRQLHQRE